MSLAPVSARPRVIPAQAAPYLPATAEGSGRLDLARVQVTRNAAAVSV